MFCLLTAYSSALTGLKCVKHLQEENALLMGDLNKIEECITKEGHRFAKQRAEYIYNTRHIAPSLKKTITDFHDPVKARIWLKNNIKGIGMKEASHFLRNVGHLDLAILDRHVLNIMLENGMIKEIPKTISKKSYLEMESHLFGLAERLDMEMGELDLYLWYMKTGEVLK